MFDEKRYKKDNEATLTRTKTLLEPTKLTESEKALIKEKHLKAEQSILEDVISEIYSSEKEYTEEDFPIKLGNVFEYPEELDCKDFILVLSERKFYLLPKADYQEIIKLKDEYLQNQPFWDLIENKKIRKIYELLPVKQYKKFERFYNIYNAFKTLSSIVIKLLIPIVIMGIIYFIIPSKILEGIVMFVLSICCYLAIITTVLGVYVETFLPTRFEELFTKYPIIEYKGINLSKYRVYGNKNE